MVYESLAAAVDDERIARNPAKGLGSRRLRRRSSCHFPAPRSERSPTARPNTYNSHRTVALSSVVVDTLSVHVVPALVAERLGHDVKTLLATYAHVIRSDEDRVRNVVDDTLGGSAEEWLRTKAV